MLFLPQDKQYAQVQRGKGAFLGRKTGPLLPEYLFRRYLDAITIPVLCFDIFIKPIQEALRDTKHPSPDVPCWRWTRSQRRGSTYCSLQLACCGTSLDEPANCPESQEESKVLAHTYVSGETSSRTRMGICGLGII